MQRKHARVRILAGLLHGLCRGPERFGYLLEEGPQGLRFDPRHRPHTHDRDTSPGLRAGAGRLSVRAPGSAGRRRVRIAPGGRTLSVAQCPRVGIPSRTPRPQVTTRQPKKGGAHVVPEAARHAARAAVGRPPGPGPELGRRPRLGRRLLDAAPPLPRARLGGRLVLRVRVDADARERARRSSSASARTAPRAVAEIVRVSTEGRAPKNDPALFALALAAGLGDTATRQAALAALPQVARTGTHLFQFATFVEGFRGWGRSLRRAVGRWYADKPVDALAYQAVKYRQRDGVTHRDLLRLAHPARRVGAGNPTLEVSDEHARLFEWIVRGGATDGLPRLVEGFARAQAAATAARGGGARPRVRPAARGAPAGAPDLGRGLGGAARGHADDGAGPQPGDDDARRRDRAGLGRHGEGRRAARRRGAAPQGTRAPDRGARRASHVRVRPRRSRPRRVEPGARGRGRARRRVLRGVRQRRAGRQAAAARARRVGLDDLRRRRRRSRPDARATRRPRSRS